MGKTVTPSEITDGQIDKAVGVYRAMLQKHRGELGSEPVQQVLGQPEFVGEMVRVLRRRIEAVSSMIVRRVKVDRTRTPQQVLDATGRRQYTDPNVVANMPGRGNGIEELDVYFFPLRRSASDEEVEAARKLHGLERPADSYAVAQVNTDDPSFADTHPNFTHWQDANGRWCHAAFDRWHDERSVRVDRSARGWGGLWWVPGLRK